MWRFSYWRRSRALYAGPSLEKILLDLLLLVKLCRVVWREKIEIIHAHNYEGALIGILAKFITGRPLLYNAVNLMSDELPTYGFIKPAFAARLVARFLDWFVPLFPDYIVALTKELRDHMLKRGISPERLAHVPCGVSLELFDRTDPNRLRNGYGSRPIVMYTGVNCAFQRIDYLLRAFSLVAKEEPAALLMVVSPLASEPDLECNQALALSLNIAKDVVWVQSQALADLPDYLALANVTVIPRPGVPGHPIKLLNYMAAGKPTVCFAGAAKGVRDMRDALVIPDHDWQQMGNAIVKLLRDPVLAKKLGTNARATVASTLSWPYLCPKIEAVYAAMMGTATMGTEIAPPMRDPVTPLPQVQKILVRVVEPTGAQSQAARAE
jgi:glycosyltransferase involved in cell wall biosynthesis